MDEGVSPDSFLAAPPAQTNNGSQQVRKMVRDIWCNQPVDANTPGANTQTFHYTGPSL